MEGSEGYAGTLEGVGQCIGWLEQAFYWLLGVDELDRAQSVLTVIQGLSMDREALWQDLLLEAQQEQSRQLSEVRRG